MGRSSTGLLVEAEGVSYVDLQMSLWGRIEEGADLSKNIELSGNVPFDILKEIRLDTNLPLPERPSVVFDLSLSRRTSKCDASMDALDQGAGGGTRCGTACAFPRDLILYQALTVTPQFRPRCERVEEPLPVGRRDQHLRDVTGGGINPDSIERKRRRRE